MMTIDVQCREGGVHRSDEGWIVYTACREQQSNQQAVFRARKLVKSHTQNARNA